VAHRVPTLITGVCIFEQSFELDHIFNFLFILTYIIKQYK
jgi:hypothetical protein